MFLIFISPFFLTISITPHPSQSLLSTCHLWPSERVRAIEEKQKLDTTRWANVPPNEEISWRSRVKDEPKDEPTAPSPKEVKEEDEEEEESGGGGSSEGGGGRERSDVWRPGGGQ